jgi:hypothetical protein
MRLRTRIFIVGFTLGSCALAAFLQFRETADSAEPEPFELFETIQTQLKAIRTQRYQQAYLQASSQYMDLNDLGRFIEATRGSQSVIRQAVRWEFGILSLEQDLVEVPVLFFLQNGECLTATYRLVREKRSWKIDSVDLAEPTQTRTTAGLRL